MFKVLFFILILMSSTVALAQLQNFDHNCANIKSTTKIAESPPETDDYMSAVVDGLNICLSVLPESKGYFVIYQGKDEMPANYNTLKSVRHLEHQVNYYVKLAKLNNESFKFIEGGFREKQSFEVWVVPKDGETPQPSMTITKPELPKNITYLYDRQYLSLPYDDIEPEEFLLPQIRREIRMSLSNLGESFKDLYKFDAEGYKEQKFFWLSEGFGNEVKSHPNSSGAIIFYADETRLDVNKIKKRVLAGKNKIIKTSKIRENRISVVDGGYRDYPQVEFWIIPPNGEFPKLNPDKKEAEN